MNNKNKDIVQNSIGRTGNGIMNISEEIIFASYDI